MCNTAQSEQVTTSCSAHGGSLSVTEANKPSVIVLDAFHPKDGFSRDGPHPRDTLCAPKLSRDSLCPRRPPGVPSWDVLRSSLFASHEDLQLSKDVVGSMPCPPWECSLMLRFACWANMLASASMITLHHHRKSTTALPHMDATNRQPHAFCLGGAIDWFQHQQQP